MKITASRSHENIFVSAGCQEGTLSLGEATELRDKLHQALIAPEPGLGITLYCNGDPWTAYSEILEIHSVRRSSISKGLRDLISDIRCSDGRILKGVAVSIGRQYDDTLWTLGPAVL